MTTLPLTFRIWWLNRYLERAGYEVIADSCYRLRIVKKAA